VNKKICLSTAALALAVLACGLPSVPEIQKSIEDVREVNEELSRPVGPYFGAGESLPAPDYTPAENAYMIGQQVDSGSVTWMVLGWFTETGPYMPAPTLYVDILMVNRGSSPVFIENYYSSKDAQGQDTYDNITATLNPGERVRKWLTFLLVEAQPSLLVLEADSTYGLPSQRLIWDLGPAPAAVTAPPLIDGEKEQTIYAVGETVQAGELTIRVTGVSYPPSNAQSPAGYKKVHVDLVFENTGSQDIEIDPGYAAWLKDAHGYEYSTAFAMNYSTIFPGGNLTTTAKFEVPETATGLMYEFDGLYIGLPKIFVRLEP